MLIPKRLRFNSAGMRFLTLPSLYGSLPLRRLNTSLRIVGEALHHRTLMR